MPPTPRTVRQPEPAVPEPERQPWSVLGPHFLHEWGYPTKAGRRKRMPEHVEILGMNGSGKSFWVTTILRARAQARGSHIVVVFTKPDDDTLTDLGWPMIDYWPPDYGKNHVVFAAKSTGISKAGREQQKVKILALLNKLWVPKSNTIIYFDEVAYVSRDLGLNLEVEKYFREGRALGITVVATTQRPQGVTRYMHSESSWTVCFAPKDDADAERMAEVLGSKRIYMPILKLLDRTKYEFLIVHNLTGKMYISWIDAPRKKRRKAVATNKPR
jgi:hypothetical protein